MERDNTFNMTCYNKYDVIKSYMWEQPIENKYL